MKMRNREAKLERRREAYKHLVKVTQGPSEYHRPGSTKK